MTARGFLRSRSAIKINQRVPVRLLPKNWEIFTDRLPIENAGGNLVHPIICSMRRHLPIYHKFELLGMLPAHWEFRT